MSRRFARYAWAVLAYNVAVVLWGAFVRATGSGAGCGEHWPLCNGEVLPRAPRVETLIEFTHRVTSGLALASVALLVVWAFRAFPRRHPARRGAAASLILIFTEALLGAGLVLFNYVARDASVGRGFYLSGHLINTLLLLGAITLTAWFASGGAVPRFRGAPAWMLGGAFALALLLGVSGAIAALGDTLFPAATLAEGLRHDFSPAANLLVRLRVLHPVIACGTAIWAAFATGFLSLRSRSPRLIRAAMLVTALIVVQLAAGLVNLFLLAPVWMQILHLLLADLLWIALVLFSAQALSHAPAQSAAKAD